MVKPGIRLQRYNSNAPLAYRQTGVKGRRDFAYIQKPITKKLAKLHNQFVLLMIRKQGNL